MNALPSLILLEEKVSQKAEKQSAELLSLPMHPHLTQSQVEEIVSKLSSDI